MLFKIKKFLLPTLIAVSKHLQYERFVLVVYTTFMRFANDDIWGVRKVCLEKLHDLVKRLDPLDIQKQRQCLDFLTSSLTDSSRWVKNQAFQLFGVITNELYDKTKLLTNIADQRQFRDYISRAYEVFYDLKLITIDDEQSQSMLQSFAPTSNDDIDKVKYNWAYYIPCAL